MVFQLRRTLPEFRRPSFRAVLLPALITVALVMSVRLASAQDASRPTESARLQAVNVLASNVWQADPKCEEALIHALRSDASETVRIHAATAFARAKYLTPNAHNALQHCTVGSSGDGFPGERTASVKQSAKDALKKHPTSANPAIIAKLRETTANARQLPAAAPTSGIPEARDGAEESSPPLPTLGRPVPTDVPCPCNNPKAAATSNVTIPYASTIYSPAPVEAAPKSSWLPFLKKRPATPAPGPVVITTFPEANPVTPTTAIAPDARPQASSIPTTDRTRAEPRSTLPSIDDLPSDPNVTLSQRRAELRESGLRDGSLHVFTERAGAGPPQQTAAPASSGIFRRWLAPAPAEVEQPSRFNSSGNIAPLSGASTLRTP